MNLLEEYQSQTDKKTYLKNLSVSAKINIYNQLNNTEEKAEYIANIESQDIENLIISSYITDNEKINLLEELEQRGDYQLVEELSKSERLKEYFENLKANGLGDSLKNNIIIKKILEKKTKNELTEELKEKLVDIHDEEKTDEEKKEIMQNLSLEQKKIIISNLSPEETEKIFFSYYVDLNTRIEILKSLPNKKARIFYESLEEEEQQAVREFFEQEKTNLNNNLQNQADRKENQEKIGEKRQQIIDEQLIKNVDTIAVRELKNEKREVKRTIRKLSRDEKRKYNQLLRSEKFLDSPLNRIAFVQKYITKRYEVKVSQYREIDSKLSDATDKEALLEYNIDRISNRRDESNEKIKSLKEELKQYRENLKKYQKKTIKKEMRELTKEEKKVFGGKLSKFTRRTPEKIARKKRKINVSEENREAVKKIILDNYLNFKLILEGSFFEINYSNIPLENENYDLSGDIHIPVMETDYSYATTSSEIISQIAPVVDYVQARVPDENAMSELIEKFGIKADYNKILKFLAMISSDLSDDNINKIATDLQINITPTQTRNLIYVLEQLSDKKIDLVSTTGKKHTKAPGIVNIMLLTVIITVLSILTVIMMIK